jgi:hypothetical protein
MCLRRDEGLKSHMTKQLLKQFIKAALNEVSGNTPYDRAAERDAAMNGLSKSQQPNSDDVQPIAHEQINAKIDQFVAEQTYNKFEEFIYPESPERGDTLYAQADNFADSVVTDEFEFDSEWKKLAQEAGVTRQDIEVMIMDEIKSIMTSYWDDN